MRWQDWPNGDQGVLDLAWHSGRVRAAGGARQVCCLPEGRWGVPVRDALTTALVNGLLQSKNQTCCFWQEDQ